MMGALGNVAEVDSLRPQFMSPEFLTECMDMLNVHCNDFKNSNGLVRALALLASDGPEAWTVQSPGRKEVLDKVEQAINQWAMDSISFVYSSLKPFFGLIKADHTQQCQHYAVWHLAKLTKAEGILKKYLISMQPIQKCI